MPRVQAFTRGYCRGEQAESRFRFAGWATGTGHENSVRPRAFYQQCANSSCGTVILTLADVPDALGLCVTVLNEAMRRRRDVARAGWAATLVDEESVLGELYAHVWHLYNRWQPAFGQGSGTFLGYATTILRQRVTTYIAADLGIPEGDRTHPKAHSARVSSSYEAISAGSGSGGTGGLDAALGSVPGDAVTDRSEVGGWVDAVRDRRRARDADQGRRAQARGPAA